MSHIRGLHHNAYRCRDSEETRRFYEDFLELPLTEAFEIQQTRTGRNTRVLHRMLAKGKTAGIHTRGIANHGFVQSVYFRDPDGYVIELTAKLPAHDSAMDRHTNNARGKLDEWQAAKRAS